MTSVTDRSPTTPMDRPAAAFSDADPGWPRGNVSSSTRYLCSAPYLRESMIPRKAIDASKRPKDRKKESLVVGRAFCRLALSSSALVNQMTAVDVAQVVHHAHIGWYQARVRDIMLCGFTLASLVLAPFGTVVWLLLYASVLMLPRMRKRWRRYRRRITGLLALGAAAVATATFSGDSEAKSLITPLFALAGCLTVYLGDAVVSWFQIRRVPRSLGRAPASRFRRGSLGAGLAEANNAVYENVVAYERDRVVGMGEPRGKHILSVPIDEPEKGETVKPFLASDLLHFIARHVRNQGVADPVTHGLPDLQVGEVLARPLRMMPDAPRLIDATRLRGALTSPPSGSAERVYMRAQATSWGGEVVGTIFVSVALEGRFLRLVVLPYVLGPIAPELRAADAVYKRNLLMHLALSPALALREFRLAVLTARAHVAALAPRSPSRQEQQQRARTLADEEPREARTLRERYSVDAKEDLHQAEDGVRMIQVMEQRVFAVTETFLRDHNIATHQFQQQVSQVLNSYVIIGDNNNMAASPNAQAGDHNVNVGTN
ncbi:MAG TPA: hypothetical protein VGX23_32580 [Actinocrinis sp.]|nr:hypothetical protein [Actinocrinis sp.]